MRWKYLQRANYGEAQVVRIWSCLSFNCKNHSQRTMSSLGFLNTMRMTLCWLLTLIRVLGLCVWNLFHTQSPQIAGDWRFSERISGGDKSSLLMLMKMSSLRNIHLTQTTQNHLTVHQELLMSHESVFKDTSWGLNSTKEWVIERILQREVFCCLISHLAPSQLVFKPCQFKLCHPQSRFFVTIAVLVFNLCWVHFQTSCKSDKR